jgi:hypothetical protein
VVNLQTMQENSKNSGNNLEQQEIETLSQYLKNFSYLIVENYIDTRIEMANSSALDDEEELDGGMKDRVCDSDIVFPHSQVHNVNLTS